MTLQEFYDELEKHDWFYEFSDDHKVWRNGKANGLRLLRIANDYRGEFKKLYDAYSAHIHSSFSFSQVNIPKPERPE